MTILDRNAPNEHTMFIYDRFKKGHSIKTNDIERNSSGNRWKELADFNHHLSFLLQYNFLEQFEGDGKALTLKQGDAYDTGISDVEDLKVQIERITTSMSNKEKKLELEIKLYERQLGVLSSNETLHTDSIKTNKNTRVTNIVIGVLTGIIAIGTIGSMIQQCDKPSKEVSTDNRGHKSKIQESQQQKTPHQVPLEEVSTLEESQKRTVVGKGN
jgi:hypothetical protein